jgi:hypothetical protein
MHWLWLFGAALGLIAALVSPRAAAAQGPTPAPLTVVLAGVSAVNSGNLNAMASLIGDDASLEVMPGPANPGLRIGGREAVIAFWRQTVTLGVQARLAAPPRVAADRVTLVVRFTDTELRARGQAGQGTVEALVVGGRVVTVVVREVTPVSLAQYEALPAGSTGAGLPRTGTGGAPDRAAAGAGGAGLALAAAFSAALLRRGGGRHPRQV